MPEINSYEETIPNPLPKSYGELQDFLGRNSLSNSFSMRLETFRRIEKRTKRPILCYATRIWEVPPGLPAFIDDSDMVGFSDLVDSVKGDSADIFIMSNGGSAEATERIVNRIRERFTDVRFIVPSNAYSAATLMCFSGDKILMLPEGTLGPIDPQLNGIPVRAILRSFETLEKQLADEGPKALTAYLPLLQKYDLHLLEQCRNAQQLSGELARSWLSKYAMKKSKKSDIASAVDFFGDWDLHKSHSRSINSTAAQQVGIPVMVLKGDLASLVRSLFHQYTLFLDKSPFYKVFENAAGINWGKQAQKLVNIPIQNPAGIIPIADPGKSGEPSS